MTLAAATRSSSMHSSSLSKLLPRLRSMSMLAAAALVAAGCATHRPAPVEDRTLGRGGPPHAAPSASGEAPLATPESPPAATYTVKRGDTLHQIALDNGLDYRELAAWNNVENVNKIYPGQVLRLAAPGSENATSGVATPPATPQDATSGVITAPLRTPPAIGESAPASPVPPIASANAAPSSPVTAAQGNLKTAPKAVKVPYSEQAVRELEHAASAAPAPRDALTVPAAPAVETKTQPRDVAPAVAPAAAAANAPSPSSAAAAPSPSAPAKGGASAVDGDQLEWAWPAKGRIVSGFSETANLKGIDIAGTAGEPVRASAPGRVVYAGNGLRGYGKLIIIKHNNTYLSAYAHNREILVKEGQQVTRGQKIAEMGSTDADQVKLHFEIRRHGKPMDPTKFLPPT